MHVTEEQWILCTTEAFCHSTCSQYTPKIPETVHPELQDLDETFPHNWSTPVHYQLLTPLDNVHTHDDAQVADGAVRGAVLHSMSNKGRKSWIRLHPAVGRGHFV